MVGARTLAARLRLPATAHHLHHQHLHQHQHRIKEVASRPSSSAFLPIICTPSIISTDLIPITSNIRISFLSFKRIKSSPGPEILCFTVMKWLDACQLCQKVMQSKRLKLLLNLEPTFLNNDETCTDFACTEMFSTQVMASLLMTIMLDATMSDENKE